MKKIVLLSIFTVFICGTSSFAALQVSSNSDFEMGKTAGKTITVGLSSNVTAAYENGGETDPQWFAIGTAHTGGTQVYGPAQDVTNLYKLVNDKATGQTIDSTTFSGMPQDSDSSNDWSSGVWEKM